MSTTTATERSELLEVARELARHELTPRALELDAGSPASVTARWHQLAELGFDRALLDERYGGAGIGAPDLLAVIEELAVGDGGIAMCVLLSNAALAAVAPDEFALIVEGARWVLVPVRSGVELTPSQGSLDVHVASAVGVYGADGIVLLSDEPSSIAVRGDCSGLECRRDHAQMGLRAAPAASIAVSGMAAMREIDPTHTMRAWTLLWTGTAAIARGIARRAYEMALAYAEERRQGGVAIVEHDAVGDMLAAMAVRLAVPLPALLEPRLALAAKIAHTDAAVMTTTDAVQVFGGIGYMHDTGVEKLMRDAKYCQLFPESNWVAQDELLRHVRQSAGRG